MITNEYSTMNSNSTGTLFEFLTNQTLWIIMFHNVCRKDRAAPVNLWSKLLKDTKYKAKTSASLGDILSKNIATRFSDLSEDINRISKNVSTNFLFALTKLSTLVVRDIISESLSNFL